MDRRKIESITASLAIFLLLLITFGTILAIANTLFKWDIFPPDVETVMWFFLASCVVLIVSSVLVNVMLNLSIIAINSEILNKKLEKSLKDKNE